VSYMQISAYISISTDYLRSDHSASTSRDPLLEMLMQGSAGLRPLKRPRAKESFSRTVMSE
jgi:hypothetical protein